MIMLTITTMIMGPSTLTTIITTTTTTTTTMSMDTVAEANRGAALPLLIWLSPTFPVGAFAYSHGLEWAVEAGDVFDTSSLKDWLIDLLAFGAPRSDAILFASAFRAAAAADWPKLMELNGL